MCCFYKNDPPFGKKTKRPHYKVEYNRTKSLILIILHPPPTRAGFLSPYHHLYSGGKGGLNGRSKVGGEQARPASCHGEGGRIGCGDGCQVHGGEGSRAADLRIQPWHR